MMKRDDLDIEDISEAILEEEAPEAIMKAESQAEGDALASLLDIASALENKKHPVDYVHRLTHKFKTLLKEGQIKKSHLSSLGEKLVLYSPRLF